MPAKAPDPIASVIALEVDGPPSVEPVPVPQLADGSVTLGAGDATIHGDTAKLGALNGRENIGSWTNTKDWVSWEFVVTQPGTFNVVLNYACDPASAGAVVAVECGDQKVETTVSPTQNGSRYRAVVLGDIKITAAGKTALAVKPTSVPHGEVMNLKSVMLRPGM